MAGWGRRFRIAIQGQDPRRNGARRFIWHLFQARPGGGASSAGDGWPGGGEWQAAGGIKFGSLEVTEVRFPLFFRRHEFRPDSGGDGQYRGGPGGDRRDGRRDRRAGARQHRRRRRASRRLRHPRRQGRRAAPLHAAFRQWPSRARSRPRRSASSIRPGDRLVLESGGGGGWGDPAERSAEAKAADARSGFSRSPHAGRGPGEGQIDVPHRHRCRRHLHRSGRDRRSGRRRPSPRSAIDARRSLARRARRPARPGRRRSASTAPRCSPRPSRIVHGTTVATNALLERKGARVGLLTTEGHRDVIEMREGLKDDRYNLRLPPPEPLVPRAPAPRRCASACAPTAASRRRSTMASLDARHRRAEARAGRGGRGLLPARLARPGA